MGERMTGADAAWFHMDRRTNRMIVNMVLWFDRTPDWDAVRDAIRERWVERYPRFRQRIAEPTLPLPPLLVPEWVDDPTFRFENHIRQASLPAPGDEAALHDYIESHIADPLDVNRPLWEVHLLDGYQGGGALVLRANHALGDGTALMHVVLALADAENDEQPHRREEQGSTAITAPPVDGQGGPFAPQVVAQSASDWITSFPRAFLGDRATAKAIAARVTSLAKLAVVRQDRPTVLRDKLGTKKTVTWCEPISVESVKAAAKEDSATLNDVLLAAIGAALGRYLREHGSDVDEIGAMLPFNLRSLDQPMPRSLGNKFGLVYPDIPVREMGRRERIAAVHKVMERIKLARQANVVFGWVSSVGLTAAAVENALIDRYAGMSSVIITNVTGPRHQFSIAGVKVDGLLFWVPTSGPVGVGLSLVSYAGKLTLGIMVDSGLVPDADRMRALLEEELDEFRATAEQPEAVGSSQA